MTLRNNKKELQNIPPPLPLVIQLNILKIVFARLIPCNCCASYIVQKCMKVYFKKVRLKFMHIVRDGNCDKNKKIKYNWKQNLIQL